VPGLRERHRFPSIHAPERNFRMHFEDPRLVPGLEDVIDLLEVSP